MTTKTIRVHKASELHQIAVEPCTIIIEDELPSFNDKKLEDVGAYYDNEAKLIVDTLTRSLPAGTLDRVLRHLFERKMTYYRGVEKFML